MFLTSLAAETLLAALPPDDPDVRPCLDYVQRRRVRFYARPLAQHIGAMWLPGGVILFNQRHLRPQRLTDPFTLSLLLHEVCHLRQGVRTALSVYGELEAWQLGFRFWQRRTGRPLGAVLEELLALPLVYERKVLLRARQLMRAYAGPAYRADLLPLLPWGETFRRR